MRATFKVWISVTAAAAAFGALAQEPARPRLNDRLMEEARSIFDVLKPVPEERVAAADAVLGRRLFWDTRLSADGRTACASCHQAADWGADRRRFSPDARGKTTARNSQTVFNAMLQPALRWTGDRTSGVHQAERSLTGSMGFATAGEVVPLLRRHDYEAEFRKIWPAEKDPVTPGNYARALQAYQATLVTPAAFDRFLSGDVGALNAREQAGLGVFLASGCADCHKGDLLGGRALRKFGLKKAYWTATKSEKWDAGLYEATRKEEDRDKFRVAMLRNIARTGPYFHDGSVSDLKEAVQIMADVQTGKRLSDSDADSIVAFLQTLTGEVPAHYARSTVSPARGR